MYEDKEQRDSTGDSLNGNSNLAPEHALFNDPLIHGRKPAATG